MNIPCNGNKPKQIYTLQITEVSNSAKRHADSSENRQTVKPVTSKKNCKLFPKSIHGPDWSLLHFECLSKFWLLEIKRVYKARHVKCYFASDKQTRCWHELSKVTNQRVYQELVYRNEVFKTMLTGSPVVPSFSTRSRSSPARFFNRPHWQRAWNRLQLLRI